ncbi:MAG TPA: EAL domain-containing protein [Allosphingosinicella sp.]|nr:EAL domain-containing protein [Allosphingosinicella sp.]
MLHVYTCIVQEHDFRLVLVAGVICLLAALTAFAILEQARAAESRRNAWLALAGFVSGTGIWATHFVAMLAYQPDLPMGYDLELTLLSIAVAIGINSAGWWLALRAGRWSAALGGAVVGAGIGTMHYIGMSAVKVAGWITWDERYVIASVLIGVLLSAAAAAEHRRRRGLLPWRSALLFTLAICGLHFTAMAAAGIYPNPALEVPASAIGSGTLTLGVVAMAFLILSISFAMVLFDRKLARNAAEEARRLQDFADAAIEGLVVIEGERVLDANHSFRRLAGYESEERLPQWLGELFCELDISPVAELSAVECRLIAAGGREREVEVLLRRVSWRGAERRMLAVRDISERKEAAARIAHLAYHDSLTGLPNRAVFTEHLARSVDKAAEQATPLAVLCIDLDGFKTVNDLYGHPAGDELLIEVAQRLRAVSRGHELVARLGGDEFAIVQEGGSQPGHADLLSERIITALRAPFPVGGQQARISASIGVAVFPADAQTASDLIKNADMALYRAKAEGRGLSRFYEAAMDEALRQRRQLEADLRGAIDNGELKVHYQPLAELEGGAIIGFEALLRWDHPRLGPISPEMFIRLAEESGLIIKLGEWVLRQACTEAKRWTPPLKLSVNLSPLQFMQDDPVGAIEQVLIETGLDPSRLDLEVTEGLLIKDAPGALAVLEKLQALGVRISMDDFGTGYSSLSYFRLFPFDKVKIDRSFVADMLVNPQARAIIRSVIGLGHGLGVPVVAEGVETAEQLDALRAEGCDQVQGYLIARPNPISHFESVVLDRSGGDAGKVVPLRRRG